MGTIDTEPSIETSAAATGTAQPAMTLQKAIDLGEYDVEYLAKFPEWHTLSHHTQFQLIRQALDNRKYQLVSEWAAVSNTLELSKKPQLQEALRNIEKQQKQLQADTDSIYLEWTK